MKIGFISPPVPGHSNPMSAVARELQSRFPIMSKLRQAQRGDESARRQSGQRLRQPGQRMVRIQNPGV